MSERGLLDMGGIGTVLGPNVRLTRGQLADLFGVYYGTITANIKAIIRFGAVKPSFEGTLVQVGKTILPEHYDMEMVIALVFRLDSPNARSFEVSRTLGLFQTKSLCMLLNSKFQYIMDESN